jgi:hypothetical protein
LAILAVAGFAFLREDRCALGRRAAAGRQAFAVRPDADVPERQIGLADRLAQAWRIGRQRGAGHAEHERERKSELLTRRHA